MEDIIRIREIMGLKTFLKEGLYIIQMQQTNGKISVQKLLITP